MAATWCSNTGHRAAQHELNKLELKIYGADPRTGRQGDVTARSIRNIQEKKLIRCKDCGRRLHPKAVYCIGGEFTCFALPRHKTKRSRA